MSEVGGGRRVRLAGCGGGGHICKGAKQRDSGRDAGWLREERQGHGRHIEEAVQAAGIVQGSGAFAIQQIAGIEGKINYKAAPSLCGAMGGAYPGLPFWHPSTHRMV